MCAKEDRKVSQDLIAIPKTKAHIRYKNQAGQAVPGVTTILGLLNKPALVKWANNLGLQGIDSSKYRDEMADIGTLAHYFIMCSLTKQPLDTEGYSREQIERAENCLMSFWAWEKEHTIEPLLVEEALVSDAGGFGGTVDLYCMLDGKPTLIDFKTGKAVYPEMLYQLAAYRELLIRTGHECSGVRLLRIGRDADEGFEERVVGNLGKELRVFYHCLGIYYLQKRIREGAKHETLG